ncbi:MAG: hypothetical protein QXT63_06255, partial [Thermoplasmata archaeon]
KIETAIKDLERAKGITDNYDRKQLILFSKRNLSEARLNAQKYGFEEFISTIDLLEDEFSKIDLGFGKHSEELLAKEKVEKLRLKKKDIEIHDGKVVRRIEIDDENMACEVFVKEKFDISDGFVVEDIKGNDVTYLPIGSITGPIFIKKEK